MDIVLLRRSVRNFDLDKEIPEKDLIDLVRHAEAAGTARRQKSREYIIIENKELILKIAEIFKNSTMQVKEAKQMIAVIGKDLNSLRAPLFAVQDLSLATENIMIKACEMGIGSVMLGTYPDSERMNEANKLLNLSGGKFVFTFICLGYPADGDKAFYDMNKFDESVVSFIK